MDPIRHCFEHHRHSLTDSLMKADFSQNQVTQFLPGAATGLLESSRNTGLFQTLASLFSCSQYTLLRKIDIGSIAKNTGMNPNQVTAGLRAITRYFYMLLQRKIADMSLSRYILFGKQVQTGVCTAINFMKYRDR